ncbi:MAG: tape measure protein [Brevundimonas mediterranea]|uniref:tape measure protein n=1 Tax=Brevundimonas mediterranea TaxID=74329 RepID=UPI0040346A2A
MATIASLEARYSANIIQFDRELKRLQTINKRATDRVLNDHKSSARDVNQAWAKADIGGAMNRSLGNGLGQLRTQLMASIAAITSGAGIAAAVGLADTYTRFQNSLKVAGLAGSELAKVQGSLFEIANRNGQAVEGLGQLYGRMAMATKNLGTSQADLLQVVNSVASAIKISGRPASEAAGAMTQLSQAFAGGKVRAEEWNSVVENMPSLAMALANASEKYRGNLGALKADVDKGNFSSAEMLRLMKLVEPALRKQAELAGTTAAQGFEVLKNKMIEAVGAADAQWGATRRLGEALEWLANNLDDVAQALGVVAIAMGVTLAPAIGKAMIAMTGLTAATARNAFATIASIPGVVGLSAGIAGITPAAAAARGALMLLSSATGIGLAITAVAAAVGYFAVKSYQASEATRQLRDRVAQKAQALRDAKQAADEARQQTGNLTAAEMAAANYTAALTGQVGLLENAYYRAAAAAKYLALTQNAQRVVEADADYRATETGAARAEEQARRRARGPGYFGGADGRQPAPAGLAQVVEGSINSNPDVIAARRAREDARLERDAAVAERRGLKEIKLEDPRWRPTPVGGGPVTAPKTGGGGSSGPSAEDRERNGQQAIAQAERAQRDAIRALAKTAEDRAVVAIEALADDKAMAIEAINQRVADREITEATGQRLIEIENATYDAKLGAETARRAEELREAELELQRYRNDNLVEAARLDAEELQSKADNATDMTERHDYERQALAATQRADALMFAAEQEALRLQLAKNGHDKAEIDRIIAARQANFARGQAGQSSNLTTTQNSEKGPQSIKDWADEFGRATNAGESFNQKLQNIAEGGINSITDGLTDAIMGSKSLAEAFGDMAKQMIAQLVKLMVQWAIWEAIGVATGHGPGLGAKVIGLSAFGPKPPAAPSASGKGGNWMGTNNFAGGSTWVGDTELINLPSGSQIIPANVVRNAMNTKPKTMGGGQTIVNQITVDATDAVLGQTVKGWIHEAVGQGMVATKAMIAQDQQKAGRNRLM